MRKTLVETLPVFTVLLITVSFLYNHAYFKVVNVDIYNYIDTPELLLAFVPLLSDMALLANIILYSAILFIVWYHIDNKDTDSDGGEALLRYIHKNRWTIYKIVWGITLVFLVWGYFDKSPRKHLLLIISTNISLLASFLVYVIQLPTRIYNKYSFLIFLCLAIVISSFFTQYGKYRGEKAIFDRSTIQISFLSNGDTIITNKSRIFYGETKQYLFLFEISNRVATAYKKENITTISFIEASKTKSIRSKIKADSTARKIPS